MISKYISPFSVGKRQTVSIDANDPRIRGFKANITAARLGAEINIVGDSSLLSSSYFRFLSTGGKISPSSSGGSSDSSDPNVPSTLTAVTNLAAAWGTTDTTKQDLIITFDFDTADPLNANINYFGISLVGDGVKSDLLRDYEINKIAVGQTYPFKYIENLKQFGPFQTTFDSLSVTPYDKDNKPGPTTTITNIPPYENTLPAPTIYITNIKFGYSVDWDPITQTYQYISIEEVLSEDTQNAPTSGYVEVYLDKVKPAIVYRSTTEGRWVRARFTDGAGTYSPHYSSPVFAKPLPGVAADVTPPNEVTINSAQWNGTPPNEQIEISYTIPSTDGGVSFQVLLTNGSRTRLFPIEPIGLGLTQTAVITKLQLESAFGSEYPTQFSGLFKSRDKAGNWTNGVTFSIGAKSNALAGVVPVVTSTAVANGFTLSWNLGTATYAKVYTSTIQGFTPNEAGAAQYTGTGPYIASTLNTTNFSTIYYRVKTFGPTGSDISQFSTEGSVTPLNPDVTDITPPPAVTSVTGTGSTNTSDPSGISGQIVLTITQPTMPSDLSGYNVKIVNNGVTWYQDIPVTSAQTSLTVTNGILVGQSYTISVATRDKTNYQTYTAASNNPITVNDTRVNSSAAVSNLSVSATDSIATVSWTASSDTNVASYRVQLTTFTDTDFSNPLKTIYTTSTQTSFGGLTASTSYRVRVTSKYSNNGPLSSNSAITTFTLNSSGAISDGIKPTTNPSITTANVKSLFKALAITFPSITNNDPVTYEVFIKPTDSTGIIDTNLTYKVLEIAGTFAVVRTLADKVTELSYGTDYYIAIRAKDNDGVSTGTVTPVGPVRTAQVANADVADNAIYANNIYAGQIDASKMVTDLLFTNKTINVGQSTSTSRIRLDANVIIANTNGYSNPTSPINGRIFIGSGAYKDTGTPVYFDDLGRFSLKDQLYFDGTNLTITANGTFGGQINVGPTGQTIKIGLNAGGTNNHGIYIESTGDYIYNSGNFRLGAGKITYNGSLSITSQVDITGSSTVSGDLGVTGASSTIYAGASKTTGNRVVLNSGGMFGYSGSTTNFSFPNSSGLFYLGSGYIGAISGGDNGWAVTPGKIERQTGTTWAGMSTNTGDYAFYAGGGTGGSGTPKFKVAFDGTMTASNVTIKDGQLNINNVFNVDTLGKLTATGATLTTLKVTGASTLEGNLQVVSGTFFTGTSSTSNSVSVNTDGLAAYNATGSALTEILTVPLVNNLQTSAVLNTPGNKNALTLPSNSSVNFFTKGAIIGGWYIDNTTITDSDRRYILDSANKYMQITGTDTNTNYYVRFGTHLSNSITNTKNILEAGTKDSNGNIITTNFAVTSNGTLYARNVDVAGTIEASTIKVNNANVWNSSSFTVTAAGTGAVGTVQMIAGTLTASDDTDANPDTNSGNVSLASYTAKITLDSAGVHLYGIPTLGNYTKYQSVAGGAINYTTTTPNPNNPTYGMGSGARQRMLVMDPYDRQVYRGMAVYYGSRTSAPGAGTGVAGDIWISWA